MAKFPAFTTLSVTPIAMAVLASVSAFTACSTVEPRHELDATDKQSEEMQRLVLTFTARLDALEGKMAAMNDKFEQTKSGVDHLLALERAKPTDVVAHPSEQFGKAVSAAPVKNDPEAGFVNDEPVQAYRKAMMLFQSKKYSEAVLGFSTFLEKYPDHPLAGSAQYFVGMSYVSQKEYKLALQEFSRVLTSYDRSIHVAETLREMAEAEDQLKKPEEATKHRQLLASLFPQSPASAGMGQLGVAAPSAADAGGGDPAAATTSSAAAASPASNPAGASAPAASTDSAGSPAPANPPTDGPTGFVGTQVGDGGHPGSASPGASPSGDTANTPPTAPLSK